MNMRLYLAIILTAAGLFVGCEKNEIQSGWVETAITVDGVSDDWPEGSLYPFEDSRVAAGVMNDKDNLYLLLSISARGRRGRIPLSTVTVWFDETGKRKKEFGLSYSGRAGEADPRKRGPGVEDLRGGFWEGLTEEQRDTLKLIRARMARMIRILLKDTEELISPDGEGGPAVGFGLEQGGTQTYELTMPFERGEKDGFGIDVKPGERIALGIEFGRRRPENLPGMMRGVRQGTGAESEQWFIVTLADSSKD